jgi:hypothetical protein
MVFNLQLYFKQQNITDKGKRWRAINIDINNRRLK